MNRLKNAGVQISSTLAVRKSGEDCHMVREIYERRWKWQAVVELPEMQARGQMQSAHREKSHLFAEPVASHLALPGKAVAGPQVSSFSSWTKGLRPQTAASGGVVSSDEAKQAGVLVLSPDAPDAGWILAHCVD